MTRQPLLLVTMAVLATGAACTDSAAKLEEQLAELRSERRELLMRFSSVQNAIRRTQGQALEEPGVIVAQDAFNAEVRAVVLRDDPESVELLDRARTVGHDLQAMGTPIMLEQGQEDPRPVTPEERMQVASELAEVERSLRPVINRAFQDPAVAEAFGVLRDSVVAAMLRIDPGSQISMDAMADLEAQVAEVDAEIARLSQ